MALVPAYAINCVVAIGYAGEDGKPDWCASGFLYGEFSENGGGKGPAYQTFLVTNRHVLDGKESVFLRFNPKGKEPAREYKLPLVTNSGKRISCDHPNRFVDVAVVPIIVASLRAENLEFSYFQSNVSAADTAEMMKEGVTEGDFGYILGFPMGLVGEIRNAVIVRSGVIARIQELYSGVVSLMLWKSAFPSEAHWF